MFRGAADLLHGGCLQSDDRRHVVHHARVAEHALDVGLGEAAEDGQWFVEARLDDTLKIAGKRTGPAEIEGLALTIGAVSEAAAVGVPSPVIGQVLLLALVPSVGMEPGPELERTIADAVGAGLGHPFRPKRQLFVSDLPKTRNTKILRRVVKAVATGGEPGDLTALLKPEAIVELERVAGAWPAAPRAGPSLARGRWSCSWC